MKRLLQLTACLLVPMLAIEALGQSRISGHGTITSSGQNLTFQNGNGAVTLSVEEIVNGAPATVSVVIQGCKNGGTCSTLDTYTTVANAIRPATQPSTVYDYFVVSATWTGGTNVSVVVNFTATIAVNGTGGGGSGNVSASGTPTVNQLTTWFDSTHIQGTTMPAHSFTIWEGASTPTSITCPSTNGNWSLSFNVTASAPVDPTCMLPGVTVNAQSGNYTLAYSDRATYLLFSGGTTATLTLCQIATTCANNFPFVLQNLNTENLTVTANAADCVDSNCLGGSITVGPNQMAFIYQDSTSAPGHWKSIITPTTSGTATTSLYFILNSTATGTSIGAPTLNATKLWSFISTTTVVHATKIVYAVNTADTSGTNLYNLALFDTQGNIVAQTGALAGSAFSATTGQKSVSSTAPFNVYAGVRYYVGLTGNATTALLGGANNHFDALCGAAATSNNTTASAVWTTPIGIPADSVNLVCVEPTFGFYQ